MAKTRNSRKKKKYSSPRPQHSWQDMLHVYKKNLKHFFESIGAPNVFSLFTKNELIMLFQVRYRPLHVEFVGDIQMPNDYKKRMRTFIHCFFYKNEITIVEGCPPIREIDYICIGSQISILMQSKESDNIFHNYKAIYDGLQFWYSSSLKNDAINCREIIHNGLGTLRLLFTRLDSLFVCFKTNTELQPLDLSLEGHHITNRTDLSRRDVISVEFLCREMLYAVFDNKKRTVLRVGEVNSLGSIVHTKIKRKIFFSGQIADQDKTEIDVYIQRHALQRLSERINCIETYILHKLVYLSFFGVEDAIKLKDNRYLVPFKVDGNKLGYYLGTYVFDDEHEAFVIRTFLFITNEGTPEGKKLERLLGFSKLDLDYLKLDVLSSYVHGDLSESKELYSILKKCGVEHLFNLGTLFTSGSDNIDLKLSEKILQYATITEAPETTPVIGIEKQTTDNN